MPFLLREQYVLAVLERAGRGEKDIASNSQVEQTSHSSEMPLNQEVTSFFWVSKLSNIPLFISLPLSKQAANVFIFYEHVSLRIYSYRCIRGEQHWGCWASHTCLDPGFCVHCEVSFVFVRQIQLWA